MLKVFVVLADAENAPANEYERTLVKLHKCELWHGDDVTSREGSQPHKEPHSAEPCRSEHTSCKFADLIHFREEEQKPQIMCSNRFNRS